MLFILKIWKMLKYIFASLFVLSSLCTYAQDYTSERSGTTADRMLQNEDPEEEHQPKEKLPYPPKKRGTSLTVDLMQFAVPFYDDTRYMGSVGLRTNFKKRMFFVAEAGFERIDFNKDEYEYNSNGMYAKAGLDYDIFIVDEPNNNDNILFGFRYGFALQNHETPRATIANDYWGSYETSISNYSVTSHWLEASIGLRTQLFNNFYMSWFISVKKRLLVSNDELLKPYKIPGYGTSSNYLNLGFAYQVEYLIPWGNKKRH